MMRTLQNRLLAFRYNYFQKCVKPIVFDSSPDWEEDFNNPNFSTIADNYYAGHSYCSPDCVALENGRLNLKVLRTAEWRDHWSGKQYCHWKIGWVEYRDLFPAYGTWVWKAIVPENSFSALWMLRKNYCPEESKQFYEMYWRDDNSIQLVNTPQHEFTPNMWLYNALNQYLGRVDRYDNESNVIYVKDLQIDKAGYLYYILAGQDAITPEVDVMELLNDGKFGHTLHYGFEYGKYATDGSGTRLNVKDHKKEYEFAVVISPDAYRFYIDGVLTGVMNTGLSDQPLNVIMNSAVHSANYNTPPDGDFVISEFKFYKKYNW